MSLPPHHLLLHLPCAGLHTLSRKEAVKRGSVIFKKIGIIISRYFPHYVFIMVARPLYFHPVVSSSSFFLAQSQLLQIGCLPYFHTWCGLSANLRCRSETCCTRVAENTGRKSRQKSPSGHHRTTLLGYVFATKEFIDNRKNVFKQQYVLHMSPQYGELRPTNNWDQFGSLGYPCKFQWVSHLGSVTARHLVVGVSQTLRHWTQGAPMFGRATITLGIGPHPSYKYL